MKTVCQRRRFSVRALAIFIALMLLAPSLSVWGSALTYVEETEELTVVTGTITGEEPLAVHVSNEEASETLKVGEEEILLPVGHALEILERDVPDSAGGLTVWSKAKFLWQETSLEGYLPTERIEYSIESTPVCTGTVLLEEGSGVSTAPLEGSVLLKDGENDLLLPKDATLEILKLNLIDLQGGETLWVKVRFLLGETGRVGYLPHAAVSLSLEEPLYYLGAIVSEEAASVFCSPLSSALPLKDGDGELALPVNTPFRYLKRSVADAESGEEKWSKILFVHNGKLRVGYISSDSAAVYCYGITAENNVTLYSEKSLSSAPVQIPDTETTLLLVKDQVLVLQDIYLPSTDGETLWHQVTTTVGENTYEGFVLADKVTLLAGESPTLPELPSLPELPEEESLPFEEQLLSFPEDYRPYLLALHESHPNWNFEVFHTGLNWNTVQYNENKYRRSMTNSKILSYYSTADGCYDWYNDKYVVLEGSNWYQAAPELVAYYMDPRNFLNENDVFMFEKLSFSPSFHTEEAIEQMLKGTFMEGKTTLAPDGSQIPYARAFLIAAYTANVSPFHLVTRCIQEVGWGGTAASHGTYPGYEGYYNFFNIGAYNGMEAGLVYAKEHGWDSPYKAIMAGGDTISNNYIALGQDTPYFQKYSVVKSGYYYWHQYMTNVAAAYSEGHIQRTKYESMSRLDEKITFRIPVYNSIPVSPCQPPVPTGSPNDYLVNLSVEGYSLTPTFDFYEYFNQPVSYSLIITGRLSSVKVSATAASKTATLSGDVGDVPITVGENVLRITCTSAAGTLRTYVITLVYQEGDPVEPEDPEEGEGEGGETDDPVTPPITENVDYHATVCEGSVFARTGPSTNYSKLSYGGSAILLYRDHPVIVHGEAVPADDGTEIPWYSVTFTYKETEYQGYIRSDLLTLGDPVEEPEDPESGEGGEGGEGEGDEPIVPPVESGWEHDYTVGEGTLSGVALNTDAQDLLASLGLYGNATASITDVSGNEVLTGAVRTGWRLHYYNGTETVQYVLMVLGDVSGDSEIDAVDLLLVRKLILGTYTAEGAYFMAADINGDGEVNAVDLLLVRKHILGTYTIVQ